MLTGGTGHGRGLAPGTAQLRGRLRASLLLALLVGLSGGVVLAGLAGARRSDAALPRFLAASRTTDATVWFITDHAAGSPPEPTWPRELRAVAACHRSAPPSEGRR